MDKPRLTVTETMHGGSTIVSPTTYTTTVHCELKPYPFPEGMEIPRLMPYQEYPWNGDGYLAGEVLRLKKAHGLEVAIETGTCLGSTLCWLVKTFPFHVRSYEVNDAWGYIAKERLHLIDLSDPPMIDLCRESSATGFEMVDTDGCADRTLVFLDAHWGDQCPLSDELEAIAKQGAKPCIVIHDFQVPGTDFGYDKMPDGRPFNLDLVREHLNAIYGVGGWKHNYPTKVEGANRGWISIEPVR
jgi:hypothetical protein